MTVLHPTGTCFEDVTQYFVQLLKENRARFRSGTLFMVHGICLLDDDAPYSHAWVELDDQVHCPVMVQGKKGFAVMHPDRFAELYRVQEFTRYSPKDAFENAAKTNDMPPPWEPKYRNLCRDVVAHG